MESQYAGKKILWWCLGCGVAAVVVVAAGFMTLGGFFIGIAPETPRRAVPQTTVVEAAPAFLKTDVYDVCDHAGKGDVVPLRGVNLGGWLLIEEWMCPMDASGLKDDFSAREALTNRFGAAAKDDLLAAYEDAWITEKDLDHIASYGMNVVRVPFWYLNAEDENGEWRADAFRRLDWLVDKAWQRGLYTILDLHGAPGGQSDSATTGRLRIKNETGVQPEFWSKKANQRRAVRIWQRVAEHYKGNPAVAGYDLLNEPISAPSRNALWSVYNHLYKAVRAADPDHMIFMEGCWAGKANGKAISWGWDVLPPPEKFGWTNVVYEVHSYEWDEKNPDKQKLESQSQVKQWIANRKWRVPCLIGEFNCMGQEQDWKEAVEQFSSNGMNWLVWTYKSAHGRGTDSWGLYNPRDPRPAKPDLQKDSAADVKAKWSQWSEAAFAVNPMLKHNLAMPIPVNDAYSTTVDKALTVAAPGVLANDKHLNLGDPGVQLTARKASEPAHGALSLKADGSFTYTPAAGFTGVDAFRYRAFDGRLDSTGVATVTIKVAK